MKRLMGVLLLSLLVVGMFSTNASAAISDADLNNYLQEVSTQRGWETLTKEEFNDYLVNYSLLEGGINEFETISELKEYLGEVISEDLSNIESLNELYDTDVVLLLEENNDSIDNYLFVDDLDFAVMEYLGYEEEEMFDEDFLAFLVETFGLTDQEIDNLMGHLEMIDPELSKPENVAKLEEIANRMAEFEQFDSAKDLTDEQIAELLHLSKELMNLLQLDANFFLVNDDDAKTPVSFKDLMFMEDNMEGYSLLVELYSTATGEYLADFILTADMFGSEIITDTGQEIKDTPQKEVPKTVNGAKLPKTAGDNMEFVILGLVMVFSGLWMARQVSVKKA